MKMNNDLPLCVTCQKELKQLKSYYYSCASMTRDGNFTTEKPYVHIFFQELLGFE